MRAALQVGYGDLETSVRVTEVPTPSPGGGQVLVRVAGSTLNRKDLFALANLTGPGIRSRPPLPHVNGSDAWGAVAACGADVADWRAGDRVVVYPGLYCGTCEWCLRGGSSACTSYGVIGEQVWGSHAEYLVVPARNLERVPGGMTDEALACAGGSWLTAWHALVSVAQVRPGETVLVVGASGGVGTAAVRIARFAGCRVVAVVGSMSKAARVSEVGADDVVDGNQPFAALVREATGGRGVDAAIDSVGAATWRETINSLAPFGCMTICGATSGDTPAISIREVYQHHRRILGAPLGTRSEFSSLVAALASGALPPVVDEMLPLDGIHDGLRRLASRDFVGKIAIRP
jgi:NADPH2:quinone reductase